jgi:hypothetical protein
LPGRHTNTLKKRKTDYETKNLDHLGLVAAQFGVVKGKRELKVNAI